jgi:predicted site-specific integrase-resolvase
MNDKTKPSPWRNRREAGAYLGISPKTLDEAKRKGRIEPWYMNSKPMYRTTDLDKLMTRKPNPEQP